jgi:hypothetical protein
MYIHVKVGLRWIAFSIRNDIALSSLQRAKLELVIV